MTDLSEFGAGIDQAETEGEEPDKSEDSRYKYSAGRCRAITNDGDRCRGSAIEGDLCYYHDIENDPATIDDDPITLIEWTSRTLYRNWEDELDVDVERLRRVLHNLVGLEDEPLTVSERGLWLPLRYVEADRIIIRTPTATIDSHVTGESPRIHKSADSDHWDVGRTSGTLDVRNEECLDDGDGPSVGLKIAGEDQRWFPVEIAGGEEA